MTVAATTPFVSYVAAGVGPYAVPFSFSEAAHVKCQLVSDDGVISYPVFTLANQAVTLAAAVVFGKVQIFRQTSDDQPIAYPDLAAFPAASVERSFDRLTRRNQELGQNLLSAVRVPLGETISELPPAALREGGFAKGVNGGIEFVKALTIPVVPTALSPEDFGANGKGEDYDTAALLRWRDALFVAAALNGVALGTFGGRYKINANILFSGWLGKITLMQTAAGAGPVLNDGTSRWDGWSFAGGGVTGSPTTITANAVRGDISVIVANPALFAVGNYVEIGAVDANGNSLLCWNKIVGNIGNTLLLECPLPFHVISANVTRVQKTNLQSGLIVRGMSASSTVAPGTKVQGLNFYNLVGADIRDISTSNINSFESTAVAFYGLYNCTIDNVSDVGSGYATGSSSAAIFMTGTDLSVSRINSQAATGFAIDMVNVNRSRVRDIDAMRAAGRAIKWVGCCSNEGSGFTASSTATFVGLALTGGSSDNLIMGVIANGSLTASATGVWLNGTGNVNNTLIGVQAKGNAFDIAVGNLDTGNVFDNVNNDIGVVQTGTSGAIIRTARRTFVQVRPTVAQAVASGASFVKGIYGTKVADANGEFNTATSRFTAKVPNVYNFRGQTTWNGLPTAQIVDLCFNVNANGYVGRSSRRRDTSNNFSVNHSFSVFLQEGEYVETIIGQSSGGPLSTTADFETRLEITGS